MVDKLLPSFSFINKEIKDNFIIFFSGGKVIMKGQLGKEKALEFYIFVINLARLFNRFFFFFFLTCLSFGYANEQIIIYKTSLS